MESCDACARDANLEPVPRWKAPLLFVGALLFCPCHLPVTFAVLAATGAGITGAGWLLTNKTLVYGGFSAIYLVLLFFLARWFFRNRDREAALDDLHRAHAASAGERV